MSFTAQVVHLFRKDVRRFAPFLLGLAVLAAVHVTVGLPSLGEPAARVLPLGPFPLLFAALTALVVQEDEVASDQAFWPTRPLAPGAVLTAKAAFVGLFLCVAPAAAEIQRIELLGGEGPTWGLASDALLYQTAFLTVVALAAALTRTLRGFVVLALGAAVTLAVLESATTPASLPGDDGRTLTRAYLERWIWLLLAGGLLIHQYLSRRTLRTMVLAAGAFAMVIPALHRTQLDWSVHTGEPADRFPYPDADRVGFVVESLVRESGNLPGVGEGRVGIDARVRVRTPASITVRPTDVLTRLRGPGLDRSFHLDPALDPRLGFFRFARGDVPGLRAGPGSPSFSPRTVFPILVATGTPEEMDGPLSRAERLEITLRSDAWRPAVLGTLPLRSGASVTTPAGVVTVESVRRAPRQVSADLIWRRAARALTSRQRAHLQGLRVVLYNAGREEYLESSGGVGGRPPSGGFLPGGAALLETTIRAEFDATLTAARQRVRLGEEWFEDVELLLVGVEYQGSFTARMVVDLPEWPDYGPPVWLDGRPPPP